MHPVVYSVQVVRRRGTLGKGTPEVQAALNFRVDENAAQATVLQPWLDQLRSGYLLERIEAARALASVAPSSLEDTLLTFADDPYLRRFAPLAFHRLNTPRSMAAMADLLKKTQPGTFDHGQAAAYLGHDQCADDFYSPAGTTK
jgi:hypothetical protein